MNEPIPTDAIDRRINQRAAGVFNSIPIWTGVISLAVGGVWGGGVLYSRVEATEVLAQDNKGEIAKLKDKQEKLDKDIAVRLERIETSLEHIAEKLP